MKFYKGMIPWNKGKKMDKPVWNKGLTGLPARHTTPHSEETKKKCSEAQKKRWADGAYKDKQIKMDYVSIGIKSRDKQRKGKYISCKQCNKEFYCSPSGLDAKYCSNECQGKAFSGENNCLWKGGVSAINQTARQIDMGTSRYRKWRKEVFTRDNYTCRACGKKDCYFHAHHIKEYSKYIELRYNLDNGLTLCVKCHYEIHRKEH